MNQINSQVSPFSARAADRALRPTRVWSGLLLLLMSYGLVLLAPITFNSLRLAASSLSQPFYVASWVPVALAIGLALLGGAAMVTVLKRLVSELEFQPYAGVAAAFGVLMGTALIALRAPLHLGELSSGACAVLCLLVSITGGALALRPSPGAAMMGGIVALAPAPLLVLVLWTHTDQTQSLQGFVHGLSIADRTFVGLVALFGLLLFLVAVMSRGLQVATESPAVTRGSQPTHDESLDLDLAIPLTRRKPATASSSFAFAPTVLGPTERSVSTSEPTERVSVWSFHDAAPSPDDYDFPDLHNRWSNPWLWSAIILFGVIALAAYVWRFAG